MRRLRAKVDKRFLCIMLVLVALVVLVSSIAYAQTEALGSVQVFDKPGTFVWTKPPGVTKVRVEVWGGGGGGGSAYGGDERGKGASGGDSSFGIFMWATGGEGGFGSYVGTGGAGGSASGGILNMNGGAGSRGRADVGGGIGGSAPRGGTGGIGGEPQGGGPSSGGDGGAPGGGGGGIGERIDEETGSGGGGGGGGYAEGWIDISGIGVSGILSPQQQSALQLISDINKAGKPVGYGQGLDFINRAGKFGYRDPGRTNMDQSAQLIKDFLNKGVLAGIGTGLGAGAQQGPISSVTVVVGAGGMARDDAGNFCSPVVSCRPSYNFRGGFGGTGAVIIWEYGGAVTTPTTTVGSSNTVTTLETGNEIITVLNTGTRCTVYPFARENCVESGAVCSAQDTLPVSECTYKVLIKEFTTDDEGDVTVNNVLVADDVFSCPFDCAVPTAPGKTAVCRQTEQLGTDITPFLNYKGANVIGLSVADAGDYSRGINAVFEIHNRKINPETQYCSQGSALNFCSQTDTSCGKRDCVNCNAKDNWYDTGKNVLLCTNSVLTEFREQEFRDYGCGGFECNYIITDRQLVTASTGGSCSFTHSVSVSPNVVKADSIVEVQSVAVAQGNIGIECLEPDGNLLCRSELVASNPSCSFTSPWSDTGNKTILCSLFTNPTLATVSIALTSDNLAPLVTLQGAPDSFQESAVANASCADNVVCDNSSFRLFVSSEPLLSCPDNYSQYDTIPPKNISKQSFVCAAALDTAGNAGFSLPVEFRVLGKDLPATNITSLFNGSVRGVDFTLNIADGDVSKISRCEYRVTSGGAAGNWSTRDCSAQLTITVPQMCKSGLCTVIARAVDILGREGFEAKAEYTIDTSKPAVSFLSPAAGSWQTGNFTVSLSDSSKYPLQKCEYRVLSGGAETLRFTARQCNADITVSVGAGRQCTGGSCVVEARAVSETGATGQSARTFSMDLSGKKYDFTAVGTTGFEQKDTGVNFSGSLLSAITLPTFIVCSAKNTIEECKNSFSVSSQKCGVDKPCLCGSLNSLSCDFRCNDFNGSYYLLVKGFSAFEEKVAAGAAREFQCPTFRVGEINIIRDEFKDIATSGETIRQQLAYLAEHSEGDKRVSYENMQKRVGAGLLLIENYLQYVNDSMSSPSVTVAKEVIERAAGLRKKVLDLIFSSAASFVSIIDKKMPGEAILGSNSSLYVTIKNSGNSTYAKLECESRTKLSSSCLFVSRNTSQSFFVPLDTSREGMSNISCSVLVSASKDCSNYAVADVTDMEALLVRGPVLSFASQISAPSDIGAGGTVIVQADVKNSDSKKQRAYVNCTFADAAKNVFFAVSDSQDIQSQEIKTFFAKIEPRTPGKWILESCSVYNSVSVPFAEAQQRIAGEFIVADKEIAECSLNLHCPGTDSRCFCGSGSCQACEPGSKCVNHQCLRFECTTDSDCSAGQACQNSRCVAAVVELAPLPAPPAAPVSPIIILLLGIVVFVPIVLYIYFRVVSV